MIRIHPLLQRRVMKQVKDGWLHNVKHAFVTVTEHPLEAEGRTLDKNYNGRACAGCSKIHQGKSPDEMK